MVRATGKKPDRREIGFTKSIRAQTKKPKGITPEKRESKRKAPIMGQTGGKRGRE